MSVVRQTDTIDAFGAIADTHRRRMLEVLGGGERPVNELVNRLGIRQPEVSKHLYVLRRANLVHVRRHGRQRLYRVNGATMKTVHDWVGSFEQFWDHQISEIQKRAEAKHAAALSRKLKPERKHSDERPDQ